MGGDYLMKCKGGRVPSGILLKIPDSVKPLICFFWALYIQFICFFIIALPAEADAEEILQREIQAALVIKFTDFIEWPEDSFEENSAWFTIGVIGTNDYGWLFEPFIDRLFKQKKLRVFYYADDQKIDRVQILIVSSSRRENCKALLEKLADRPILTIGDFPGFAQKGGIINFYRKPNNRIGFEININAKERARIKISSHLLRLAKIIAGASQ